MAAGATAVHVLEAIGLRGNDTVLLHGAAGGVGLMAVQLAVEQGATVLGTASPAKHDVLRDLGAVPIAYGPGLADRVRAAAPEGVHAAADLVGTDEAVDVSLELVADRKRIATIAAFERGAGAGIKLLGSGPGQTRARRSAPPRDCGSPKPWKPDGCASSSPAATRCASRRRPPADHDRPHHREDRSPSRSPVRKPADTRPPGRPPRRGLHPRGSRGRAGPPRPSRRTHQLHFLLRPPSTHRAHPGTGDATGLPAVACPERASIREPPCLSKGMHMSTYDYVIVGAGAAGCVLAARLSEDPDVRVALIEAGGPDSAQEIHVPAAFPQLFKSDLDWDLDSDPEPGLGGRRTYLPRGRMFGGSSSMNAMIYIRGSRADYDGWAAAGGHRLVAAAEVLPALSAPRTTSAARTRSTASAGR